MNAWHSGEPEVFEGDVSTYLQPKVKAEEVDPRYRIVVLLQRSDRPKYWTYKCCHCGHDIVDILNAEVQATSDLIDMTSLGNVAIGYRCGGKFCRYWYYFKLNLAA